MKVKRQRSVSSVSEISQISQILRQLFSEVNRRKVRESIEGPAPKTEGNPLDNLRTFLDNATVKNWKR